MQEKICPREKIELLQLIGEEIQSLGNFGIDKGAYRGELGCLPFCKPISNFCWESNRTEIFVENSFGKCNLPPEVVLFFCSEQQQKFSYHWLNVPIFILSEAKNIYGKTDCKWWVPSHLAGMLILEKPLLVIDWVKSHWSKHLAG